MRITVTLVQVDAVVTDSHGRHVAGLTKDDFQILQDGTPRKITYFTYVANRSVPAQPTGGLNGTAPRRIAFPERTGPRRERIGRTIALVVDDLGLSFSSVPPVREALTRFVDGQMQPDDLVAIVRTGAGIGALQQFTTDKRILHAAIERIRWNAFGIGGASPFAPAEFDASRRGDESDADKNAREADRKLGALRSRIFSVGTLGALNYIINGLRDMPGRKAVILFSDGFKIYDNPRDIVTHHERTYPIEGLRRLTDLANRAAVVIYSIDARGLKTIGLEAGDLVGSPGDVVALNEKRRNQLMDQWGGLQYLAEQTGGLFWKNTNDLAAATSKSAEDLGGYYLIGYSPQEETFGAARGEGRYHPVSVQVTRPGLHVRTRRGFYGFPDQPSEPASKGREQQLMAAISSPFDSGEFGLRLTALFENDASAGSYVNAMLHIDAHDLTFQDHGEGMHKAALDILLITYGDSGAAADTTARTYAINMNDAQYKNAVLWGFIYQIRHPIKKPGAYQLRAAVRDVASEKVGSASQFIEIPDLSKGQMALSGIMMQADPGGVKANLKKNEPGELQDPAAGPAVRIFRPGMPLYYGFVVYNPPFNPKTREPAVEIETRIFHAGRQVWAERPFPLDAARPREARRLPVVQQLSFGSKTEPGDYLLQVTAIPKNSMVEMNKKRKTPAVQWMDFDIAAAP